MTDVIVFKAKSELTAQENLSGFIESSRSQLTVFGHNLVFSDNVWDVTQNVHLKGQGNKRQRILFSNLNAVDAHTVTYMAEPFLGFAKAFIRYMQGMRPIVGFGPRLTALRALEAALAEQGEVPNPIHADARVFNRAAQLSVDRYTPAVAYRVGGQLELIAGFLEEHKLTIVSLTRWRNMIKRPCDTDRVGKEFNQNREQKMPTQAALDALPKAFRLAESPTDVLVSSVAALLCAAPNRINEVLLLPELCEVRQKQKKTQRNAYGLRWWPAKGANPMVKWVVPSMISVVEEAIAKIKALTAPARKIAKWYDRNPDSIYLDDSIASLRNEDWLSMEQVATIIGLASTGSAKGWCSDKKLVSVRDNGHKKVRFKDVEKAVLSMLPKGFPILDRNIGIAYSEALFLVRKNELHEQRATYQCMFEPISINQINTGLGGRVEHGFASIFSRLGLTEPDGSPINVSTHQFRHYLNTLAQLGGLSQLDIAKWSGRKDIQQNGVYDHVTPKQMLQKIQEAIGDDSKMFGPLAEVSQRALIPRDEFARLRIPTAHTTDLGFCVHDYTMSPCQQHRDCIQCEDLVCVKGDEAKTARLRKNLDDALELLRKAKEAVADEYYGSDRWLQHHQSTVERLSQLVAIIDNPSVPIGTVIQLSPPKSVGAVGNSIVKIQAIEVLNETKSVR